jgi:hypothetical protein
MTTFQEFVEQFLDIQHDVIRDHAANDEGHIEPLCHILHRDLGLTQTPAEDAEEIAEHYRQAGASPTDIDFTDEHRLLHAWLGKVHIDALRNMVPPTDLIAVMFLIGRRYGMREAAKAFATLDGDGVGVPDAPPEDLS